MIDVIELLKLVVAMEFRGFRADGSPGEVSRGTEYTGDSRLDRESQKTRKGQRQCRRQMF